MVKYKAFFTLMVDSHREKFEQFMLVCQQYMHDKQRFKAQFDKEGQEIREIVEAWERKLCRQMEGGNKAVYSHHLADKFRAEVKKMFPVYDEIGLKRS